MKKRNNYNNGFTLIELIIYMGIFSMVLLIMVQLFGSVMDVLTESQAKSSVTQDEEFINLRLDYDLKRASSVVSPSNLGDSSQSLQISVNGETYVYSLSNGKLVLSNNSGVYSLNGFDTTVTNLNFKKVGFANGKNSIVVTYTLTSNTLYRGRAETKNFRTISSLR